MVQCGKHLPTNSVLQAKFIINFQLKESPMRLLVWPPHIFPSEILHDI